MADRIGSLGESLACVFLAARGCRIVDRNVYVGADEIDVVIDDVGRLAAVEVKTASGRRDPMVAFDDEQYARLRRATSGLPYPVGRLDLIAVHVDASGATIRWCKGVR